MINLQGDKIYLRSPEQRDADLMYVWENNTNNWQVSNTIVPYSKFSLEQYLLSAHLDLFTNKQIRLMICTKNHDAVGCIDLFDFDPHHNRAGIGILIDEAQQGNGFADDALLTLIKYCFRILFLNQIYCSIGITNEKSLSLFKKHRFNLIGIRKAWNKISKNEFEDEYLLQLIND
jgi:diamine N-acetyltransferase